MSTPLLTVSGVSKRFGGLQALSEVELTIQPGQIHGLIGPNGAGKTTVFNLLTKFLIPTSGEILFNGQNLLAATEAQMIDIRRHKMGMVFQHFALLPHLTVLDNVAFPLEVQGVARPARLSRGCVYSGHTTSVSSGYFSPMDVWKLVLAVSRSTAPSK